MKAALSRAKEMVPAISQSEISKTVSASDTHAMLYVMVSGVGPREVMLIREPFAVHVWRLESHGRRWLPVLEATTDTRQCLAELPAASIYLHAMPAPQWRGGVAFDSTADTRASSIVITRPKPHGSGPEAGEMRFLPERYLRGILPEALLAPYLFWQRADACIILGERPKSASSSAPDELSIVITPGGEAIARRTPLAADGSPQPSIARRLLTHLHCAPDSPLHQLVALLCRLDDAAHILMWSAVESECNGSSDDAVRGEVVDLPVDLVELPRLRLSFRVVYSVAPSGEARARLASVEHPGLEACLPRNDATKALLRGVPHALLMTSGEGDVSILLPALAKPCLLSEQSNPLTAQLLLATHAAGWAEALPAVRHYLYGVHRSTAYITSPSLAATLYLLLLRWISRDYEAAFTLCAFAASDLPLSAEEAQVSAARCRLRAAGCSLLAAGCSLLAASCSLLAHPPPCL